MTAAAGRLRSEFPGGEFVSTAGIPIIALLPTGKSVLRTCGSRLELLNLETADVRNVPTQSKEATSCVAISARA